MTARSPITTDRVVRLQLYALRALVRHVEATMAEGAEACQLTLTTEGGEAVEFVVEVRHD